MFSHAKNFKVHGGHFNVVSGDQTNHTYANDPLRTLWKVIEKVGAGHDSEMRYPPPKCHPNTRQKTLTTLHEWVKNKDSAPVFWLYGPAGAGKSAIAQTFAEHGERDGFLASSFFFSRGNALRNNSARLFL
ncbi:hypothetical protein MPER_04805, partial [Moniliophthora perniciosa FA553]